MAFHFSLATVLRVRTIIEEREEGKLQRILFDISKVFDDLERIDGNTEYLAGKIQERYGIAKDVADKQVKEFQHNL